MKRNFVLGFIFVFGLFSFAHGQISVIYGPPFEAGGSVYVHDLATGMDAIVFESVPSRAPVRDRSVMIYSYPEDIGGVSRGVEDVLRRGREYRELYRIKGFDED
jgi:hypothetical protein